MSLKDEVDKTDNNITMASYRLTYSHLAILMLAASCSQDDVGGFRNDDKNGRIEFRASLPEIASRATEVDGSSLDNFMVSSFTVGSSSLTPYFIYKRFIRSGTDKFVSSDPECIWPNHDDDLRFVAFSPSCEDMRQAGYYGDDSFILPALTTGEAMGSGDYKLSGFRIAGDIARQFDFVTAVASGRTLDDEESVVTLNFRHQLSRIRLNAWGAPSSFHLEIAGVRFGGVGVGGNFIFTPYQDNTEPSESGVWEAVSKGKVDYIFRKGDKIVTLDGSEDSPSSAGKAVSILGAKIGGADGYDNSAMIVPSDNSAWDYKGNPVNIDSEGNPTGMYFSVLVRVADATTDNTDNIVYPYPDYVEGMEVVYLAVNKDSKSDVMTRLYKQGDEYFTDSGHTEQYYPEENNAEVKAFGWAALPVSDEWKPGYVYTYTLNYSNGVGLHDPDDPKPGDPIISDRVIVNVEIAEWLPGSDSDVEVPRK